MEDNAIISVDCGTNTSWAARYIDIRKGMKFSVSGTLSSMANGLPYAIVGTNSISRKTVYSLCW